MGFGLERCPTLHACCGCVPLRRGVALGAAAGLCGAALALCALAALGAPRAAGDAARPLHVVYGILLCAVHVLLFVAALYEVDCLCDLYVWFMLLFWIACFCSTTIIVIFVCVARQYLVAVILVGLSSVLMMISIYFSVVVANYRATIP